MPSENFEIAFSSHCSGIVRTCSCGITYFTSDGEYEKGEYEDLDKKRKNHPDKYIEQDEYVSTMEIDGNEFVIGCKCGRADKYEQFILRHSNQIADYLNKRSKELLEKSERIKVGVSEK